MSETSKAAADSELVMRTLVEMFRADTEYGCGFYNYQPWRDAYAKLQRLSGYSGATAVFDGTPEDLDDLPEAL